MPARSLTARFVESASAPAGQRLQIMDADAKGLCLRVTDRGAKTWSFVYRPRHGGPQRRLTIGDFPSWSLKAAREKALSLRKMVQDGLDPVVEGQRAKDELSLTDLAARFIRGHAKAKLRSWADYDAMLKRSVLPDLGARKAKTIQRADVARLLDDIAAKTPVTANRVQAVLSSLFTWATNEGLVDENPILRLSRRATEKPKQRVLSDHEIRQFWATLESAAPAYRDVLRLILLTGQRPGECAGIAAEEVNVAEGTWVIPAARAKNKRSHAVPLVGEARTIVERLAEGRSRGPLIATPRGKALTSQNLAKAMERLSKALGESATPHDLRRTAATTLARLGVDRLHIGAVLNHVSTTGATVTGSVYDRHSYLPEKSKALTALDVELLRIIEGRQATENVIALASARRA